MSTERQPPAAGVRGGRRTARGDVSRGQKVANRIAREIVSDIVVNEMQPGEPLPAESAMLESFGVSRASLREALRILETQGLITIKPGPGGGPFVAAVDSSDFGRMATLFFQLKRVTLGAVVEARLAIEPMMARFAAQRHDPALNDELEEIVQQHFQAATDAEWFATVDDFHSLVCRMSGNPLLDLIAGALKDIYADRVTGFGVPEENRGDVRSTHRKIARAIIRGDGVTAERLMRGHMVVLAQFFERNHPGLMDELVDWY